MRSKTVPCNLGWNDMKHRTELAARLTSCHFGYKMTINIMENEQQGFPCVIFAKMTWNLKRNYVLSHCSRTYVWGNLSPNLKVQPLPTAIQFGAGSNPTGGIMWIGFFSPYLTSWVSLEQFSWVFLPPLKQKFLHCLLTLSRYWKGFDNRCRCLCRFLLILFRSFVSKLQGRLIPFEC